MGEKHEHHNKHQVAHTEKGGHAEHHDHHDHHESESESEKHPFDRKGFVVPAGHPLDFTKKHPVFNIELTKSGPEFSTIDDMREEYIKQYAGRIPKIMTIEVPKNIPGLVPKVGDLPRNRNFWSRPTMSIQRNGTVNFHTPNFNTRITYPFFFVFLLYGWWGHPTYGWYKARYEDNDEIVGNMYDKLNTRVPPATKIWLRPG